MLYDYLGRSVQTKALTDEQAAPTLSGVRHIWDESIAAGLTPYRLANLLQSAAEGDFYEYLSLAEEMEERDLHYRCEISKRKMAVTSLPVTVEAASDSPRDVEMADAIRDLIKMDGFRGLLKDQMDAIGKGYSVCEIIWRRGQRWLPERYEWRDQRFFTFDLTTRRQLRLLDESDAFNGIELAPYKYICHLPHLKTGIPIRGGLARVVAWSWMCKNYTVKDWMAFAEVFGMPLRVGKYQPGANKDDIAILKMAVANLGSDAAAVIPDSMLIEFVEQKTSSSIDIYRALADWLDSQISRGILGQTATTQGTPGKLGNEQAQADVRDDIRDDDAVQLAETLNRDLVRPYIDLNFGPQQLYPELIIKAIDEEDLGLLVNALEKLVPLGLRVEQSVIRDKLGLPDPDDDSECLGAPQPAPDPAPVSAEQPKPPEPKAVAKNAMDPSTFTPEQQSLEHLADRCLVLTDLQQNEDRILQAVLAADSYDQATENLLALWPDLDMESLRALSERAMVAAEMHGRMIAGETHADQP